jgi:hypothetical protein
MKYDLDKIDSRASKTKPIKWKGKKYLTILKIAYILDKSKGTVYNYIMYYKPNLKNYFIRATETIRKQYPMGTHLMPLSAAGKFFKEFLDCDEAEFIKIGDELD